MSKRENREIAERKRKDRNRLTTVVIAVGTLIVVLLIAYLLFFSKSGVAPVAVSGPGWHLDSNGLLAFDARPALQATVTPVSALPGWTPDNVSIENVSFESFGTQVHALLSIPTNVSHPPVVIVLPAASINKEADAPLMAKALASWGYASLTLDERGNNGETSGPSASNTASGLEAFENGGDPVQYAQFYDVLRCYDYVESRPDLDGGNVSVIGESIGTWYAIVAAALEPRIKMVCEISAVPYSWQGTDDPSQEFYKSIEPASYLSALPPRKIAFFHFTGDPIVPIAYGREVYAEASDPKVWHQYDGNVHGLYSDIYAADLHSELRSVFGR